MEITQGPVLLRDYRESDIEDDLRWMTTETAWIQADTPWEKFEPADPEELKSDLKSMAGRYAPGQMRSRMEIEAEGRHIGFVCVYPLTAGEISAVRAVGIEICEPAYWRRGFGACALAGWMEYLRGLGEGELYLETWSGNAAMMKCAEKMGFTVCRRDCGLREVNGRTYDALLYRAKLI